MKITFYIQTFINILKTYGLRCAFRELCHFYCIFFRKLFPIKKFKTQSVIFISGAGGASMQYRCKNISDLLNTGGVSSSVYEDYQVSWPLLLQASNKFILHRVPLTPVLKRLIQNKQKQGGIFIFDTDDYVFDPKNTPHLDDLPGARKTRLLALFQGLQDMLKICNYATASTTFLQKKMQVFMSSKVEYFPNFISPKILKKSQKILNMLPKKQNNDIILGYFSGSRTHDDDFKVIESALLKCFEKYPSLKLKIVGFLNLPKSFEKFSDRIIRYNFVSQDQLLGLISMVDINLVPLVDTPFNHGKSDIKFLEAGLVKIPTIASDIGQFTETIMHNKNGISVKNTADWFLELDKLIQNPGQQKELGRVAFNFVCNKRITHQNKTPTPTILDKLLKKH